MSTLVGALMQAIGDRLAIDLPAYEVVYGLPTGSDFIGAATPQIRVHYQQERGTFNGSQLGGPVRVSPMLSVTLQRPYTGTPSELASQQSSAELAADLRLSICEMLMDHVTGIAPITAFAGQALWATDYTMTDSVMYNGEGQSLEAITMQISFEFSRNYGGR